MRREYQSPIELHVYTSGPKKNIVEIEHVQTRKTLATCFIGDDDNMERIADILSQKGLPREAMKLREVAVNARLAR